MLQLVLGPSGSGKSSYLLGRIKARAEAGQRSLLLVPEQFTSSTENRIYTLLGDEYSGWVESHSFTSLSEKLLNTYGGAAVRTLTDAGRAVLVTQYRYPLGRTLLEIPAGKLEYGEDPLSCGKRELKEEIGRNARQAKALAGEGPEREKK